VQLIGGAHCFTHRASNRLEPSPDEARCSTSQQTRAEKRSQHRGYIGLWLNLDTRRRSGHEVSHGLHELGEGVAALKCA